MCLPHFLREACGVFWGASPPDSTGDFGHVAFLRAIALCLPLAWKLPEAAVFALLCSPRTDSVSPVPDREQTLNTYHLDEGMTTQHVDF